MDEFKTILGEKKEPLHITIHSAKEAMCRGLRYFLGDDAKWLQGYDEIATWLSDNQCRGLLLYGANGRGKTIMCYKIIPTLIEYYHKEVSTIKLSASSLHYFASDERNKTYDFLLARVVFIDDFGVESITSNYGMKRDVFSELVDEAEKQQKILVLTTNLTPDEIKQRYGLRTLDRLQAITRAICLNGESMRKHTSTKIV